MIFPAHSSKITAILCTLAFLAYLVFQIGARTANYSRNRPVHPQPAFTDKGVLKNAAHGQSSLKQPRRRGSGQKALSANSASCLPNSNSSRTMGSHC
jgi:hypothetical protein